MDVPSATSIVQIPEAFPEAGRPASESFLPRFGYHGEKVTKAHPVLEKFAIWPLPWGSNASITPAGVVEPPYGASAPASKIQPSVVTLTFNESTRRREPCVDGKARARLKCLRVTHSRVHRRLRAGDAAAEQCIDDWRNAREYRLRRFIRELARSRVSNGSAVCTKNQRRGPCSEVLPRRWRRSNIDRHLHLFAVLIRNNHCTCTLRHRRNDHAGTGRCGCWRSGSKARRRLGGYDPTSTRRPG